MISRIARLGLLVGWVFLGTVQAQEPVGYVLVVEPAGGWTAPAKLTAGMPVFAGKRIEGSGKLAVAYLDGTAPVYKSGFTVPALHDAATPEFVRLFRAVASSLSTQKRALVFGISRGSMELAPAVLKLTDRRVDLAPSMGQLDAGAYQVEFTPLGGGATIEAKCDLDPPARTSATVAALSPGAYTLRVASASGTPRGSTTVLVVPAAEFDARTAEFHQGVAIAATWPDPQARGTFLAALLAGMAAK